jgi:hypothetical protein
MVDTKIRDYYLIKTSEVILIVIFFLLFLSLRVKAHSQPSDNNNNSIKVTKYDLKAIDRATTSNVDIVSLLYSEYP